MKNVLKTSSTVEHTHATVTAIMYLVVAKHRVTLSLYPDASHCIVKDLVVLDHSKATVVHQDSSILSTPDLIAPHQWVTSSPVTSPSTQHTINTGNQLSASETTTNESALNTLENKCLICHMLANQPRSAARVSTVQPSYHA